MRHTPATTRPPEYDAFDTADEAYIFTRDLLRVHEGRRRKAYIPPVGRSSATISTGLDLGQHDVASLHAMGIPAAIVGRLAPLAGRNAREARQILHLHPLVLSEAEDDAVEEAIVRHFMHTTAQAYDAAQHTTSTEVPPGVHSPTGGTPATSTVAGIRTPDLRRQHTASTGPESDAESALRVGGDAPTALPCGNGQAVAPATSHHRNEASSHRRRFSDLPKELQAPVVSVLFQHGSPRAVPRFWALVTRGDWRGAIAEMRSFYRRPTVLQMRRDAEAGIMETGLKRLEMA